MNALNIITEHRTTTMAKRHQIYDPAEAARQKAEKDPRNWGVNRASLDLAANQDVDYQAVSRTAVERARRYDVFERMAHHHHTKLEVTSLNAVRRLQECLAVIHRTQGASDAIRTTGKGSTAALAASAGTISTLDQLARFAGSGFGQAQIKASEAVRAVLGRMTPWRAKLILELCETPVLRGSEPNWHAVVRRHTGEMERAKRGDIVRACADELAEAWKDYDNAPGEMRAAG